VNEPPDVPRGDGGTRLDRELNELLQELRVLLVAVTVVFGFLLGVPFTQVFHQTAGGAEEIVYFVAFVATAISILVLVTPGAWHRLRWRSHDKEALLRAGNRFTIVGTIFAAVAVCAVVLLITEALFGWALAAIASSAFAVVLVALWYALPLSREVRAKDRRRSRSAAGP
jgi:amino acid transporter